MFLRTIIYTLFLFTIAGCDRKTPQQKLVSFINDPSNNITQTIQVGNVGMIAKFLPSSYRHLLMRNKTGEQQDGFTYFSVKLNGGNQQVSSEKKSYLDYNMQDDFVLLCDNDSISASICQPIEDGVSGSYQYILAFEANEDASNNFTLYYKDKIFGIGTVAFVYNKRDISKIPSL